MQKVAPKMLEDYPVSQKFSKSVIAFVYSPGLSQEIHQAVEKRAREMGFSEVLWIETGCVVSTHSGPGAFGISGFAH